MNELRRKEYFKKYHKAHYVPREKKAPTMSRKEYFKQYHLKHYIKRESKIKVLVAENQKKGIDYFSAIDELVLKIKNCNVLSTEIEYLYRELNNAVLKYENNKLK